MEEKKFGTTEDSNFIINVVVIPAVMSHVLGQSFNNVFVGVFV